MEELRQGRCVFVHCISGESRAPVRSRQHECPLCVRTHGVGGGNRVPFDAPAETVETDAAGRLSFLTQGAFNLVSPLLDCPLSASLRRIAFAGFCPTWGPPPRQGLFGASSTLGPVSPAYSTSQLCKLRPCERTGGTNNMKVPGPPRVSVSHGEPFQYMSLNVAAVLIRPGGVMGAGVLMLPLRCPSPRQRRASHTDRRRVATPLFRSGF